MWSSRVPIFGFVKYCCAFNEEKRDSSVDLNQIIEGEKNQELELKALSLQYVVNTPFNSMLDDPFIHLCVICSKMNEMVTQRSSIGCPFHCTISAAVQLP